MSKTKPLTVNKTLPGHPDPIQVKGRIITLEFESCFIVATYVVNAGQNLKVYNVCLLKSKRGSNAQSISDTGREERLESALYYLHKRSGQPQTCHMDG